MSDKDVMTVKDLCDYLRLSKKTILRILKEGQIPARKVGGSWRILKGEVDKYLRGDDG